MDIVLSTENKYIAEFCLNQLTHLQNFDDINAVNNNENENDNDNAMNHLMLLGHHGTGKSFFLNKFKDHINTIDNSSIGNNTVTCIMNTHEKHKLPIQIIQEHYNIVFETNESMFEFLQNHKTVLILDNFQFDEYSTSQFENLQQCNNIFIIICPKQVEKNIKETMSCLHSLFTKFYMNNLHNLEDVKQLIEYNELEYDSNNLHALLIESEGIQKVIVDYATSIDHIDRMYHEPKFTKNNTILKAIFTILNENCDMMDIDSLTSQYKLLGELIIELQNRYPDINIQEIHQTIDQMVSKKVLYLIHIQNLYYVGVFSVYVYFEMYNKIHKINDDIITVAMPILYYPYGILSSPTTEMCYNLMFSLNNRFHNTESNTSGSNNITKYKLNYTKFDEANIEDHFDNLTMNKMYKHDNYIFYFNTSSSNGSLILKCYVFLYMSSILNEEEIEEKFSSFNDFIAQCRDQLMIENVSECKISKHVIVRDIQNTVTSDKYDIHLIHDLIENN